MQITIKYTYFEPMQNTVLNHINTLPDGYRELAIANLRFNHEDITPPFNHPASALTVAFNWSRTPQGRKFWLAVHKSLYITKKQSFRLADGTIKEIPAHRGKLPPLPNKNTYTINELNINSES